MYLYFDMEFSKNVFSFPVFEGFRLPSCLPSSLFHPSLPSFCFCYCWAGFLCFVFSAGKPFQWFVLRQALPVWLRFAWISQFYLSQAPECHHGICIPPGHHYICLPPDQDHGVVFVFVLFGRRCLFFFALCNLGSNQQFSYPSFQSSSVP